MDAEMVASSFGVPVGAFVVPAEHTNTLRSALKKARWLKTGGLNTTPFVAEEGGCGGPATHRALHVSPAAAAAMSDGGAPALLIEAQAATGAQWIAGLRVRSKHCLGDGQAGAAVWRNSGAGWTTTAQPSEAPQPNSECGGGAVAAAAGEADGQQRGGRAAAAAFTYSELFAGVGGFRVGLDALGGRSVFASELDAEAREVYRANFGDTPDGDITEIEAEAIPPHDVLTGKACYVARRPPRRSSHQPTVCCAAAT